LLNNIGATKAEAGDLQGALEAYDDALAIRQRTGTLETPAGADLLMNMGAAREDLGDLDGALRDYESALSLREQTGALETANGALLLMNIENAQAKKAGIAERSKKVGLRC